MHLGRQVEYLNVQYPVEPEVPHPLRQPAPPPQVSLPLIQIDQQLDRIHITLGRLVATRHVVAQVDPFAGRQSSVDGGGNPGTVRTIDFDCELRTRSRRCAGRILDLGHQSGDGVTVAARLGQHPQRDQERARLVGRQPQRAGDRFGLADRDLSVLVGEVDRAVRLGGLQLHAPGEVEVVDQLPLGHAEGGRGLGEPDRLPGDHVGDEREEAAQALGRGHHPRSAGLVLHGHASAPFSRLMTDSRRSGGSSTTRSGPNEAR